MFAPRQRHSVEPLVTLCGCSCHDRCPAAQRATVPLGEWAESCTCAGSGAAKEQARSRLRDHGTSFSDIRHGVERNIAQRDEAIAAARLRGSGRSWEEVRRILTEEYTARGLKVPHEGAMGILIDSIVNPGMLNAGVRAVRMLAGLGHEARSLIQLFGNAKPIRGPEGSSRYFVPPDHSGSMTEVILDPEAEAALMAVRRSSSEPDDLFPVWLSSVHQESSDSAVVSVTTASGLIGVLSPEDGRSYEYALGRATASGRTLTVMARSRERPDGRLSVRIFPAGTAWWED